MPQLPAGRGLGGVMRVIPADFRADESVRLEMDEVVVGLPAVVRRRWETGSDGVDGGEFMLDIQGIEAVVADALATFASILGRRRPTDPNEPHRLRSLIALVDANSRALRAGGNEVDVYSILSLHRATEAFRRWRNDALARELIRGSRSSTDFDHNVALLQVASVLEGSQLGPEFVPTSEQRTPDLTLRISATHAIDVDMKAPLALQRPRPDEVRELDDPPHTIRAALRRSRGQFRSSGMLVVAGDFWLGGVEAYAAEAARMLAEPLTRTAGAATREHYRKLLGLLFVSTGYEQVGERGFRARLFSRWTPSPRYDGPIRLELPDALDGTFTIGIDTGVRRVDGESSGEMRPHDPMRFRKIGDHEVEVEGLIRMGGLSPADVGQLAVTRFPEGYRPAVDVDFDVPCEAGRTVVTITTEGLVLVDPQVGWISLHGISFKTR
jgi:hypothetical protein